MERIGILMTFFLKCFIHLFTEHAKQWIACLGKLLRDSAKDNLFQLNDNLDVSLCLLLDGPNIVMI